MSEYEINKLKKELQRRDNQLKEEKSQHAKTLNDLAHLKAEHDRYYNQLLHNRDTISKVDTIMTQKKKEIQAQLEKKHADSHQQIQELQIKLDQEERLKREISQEYQNQKLVISDLSLRLKQMSDKYSDKSLLINIKQAGDQAAITNNNFYKLTEKYTKACADMENVLAENKILRKLHGVPQNFGFDLEEIKIAQKQELEDYKAQCRKLEAQLQELEEQRAQLRAKIRNTIYSNKGDRYKDMTTTQLELLDQYAMNLKEGRVQLPQIDKTTKELNKQIFKLKSQIQILQNKAPTTFIKPSAQADNSDKLPLQTLRKMEEQIIKLLAPIREDVSKISDMKVGVQQPSQVQIVAEGPHHRPPMPLPIAHNDWSQIKDGFSYLYNSKIPIDLKGVEDQGSFNIARARYEVAALQLQNMESLKLLREKQVIEDKLAKQVNDLKQKYGRCLRVQDKLFLQFFKEKEQDNDRIRKLQVEKRNLTSQKAGIEVQLNTIQDSFHIMSKKTDVQKRCVDLTSRLAIAESQLLKFTRKYQVLNEQHLLLQKSYSSLEEKWASTECSLKDKLAYAKKNEKELCFYLNKILEEGRDSVGRDIHEAAVNKLQNLTDKSLSSAIKQTELRVRINQLQNIERELTLKDDVIQTLREDNFDLILELQIVKSRLETTDKDYRHFQDIFKRLINFINNNNVSLLTYFKKFDKDGGGDLSKTEFVAAIRALGFDVTNNQFDLLFNQFDLDGSQTVSYRQFLRKMRRSGVFTRSAQEEALYRLFRAIKKANITVRKAFQIIDMDGSNQISKTEMESAFRKIGIDISTQTVDFIFKMCDDDMSGTISCAQFQKLFDNIIRESVIEDKEVFAPQIDWKLMFVLKMEESSERYHKGGLKQTFDSLDADGSHAITLSQLAQFFKKAQIEVSRKEQLELFEFLDRTKDGKVEYFQFLKILEQARQEKKRVDRMKYIKARTEQLKRESRADEKDVRQSATEQKTLKIKLMSLQSKHTSLLKKNDKLIKSLVGKETDMTQLQRQVQQLQKNVDQIRSEYYSQKQTNIKLQQQVGNRISQVQSKTLTHQNRQLTSQLQQLSNDLQLYKKLYEDLSTKNRYDEMRVVKVESELQKYYQIVKDLQGQSDSNAELGKKVYQLEVSKRNQEITNKKFSQAMEELRLQQGQVRRAHQDSMDKEKQIINTHFFLQNKTGLLQQKIDQLQSKMLPTINPHKVNQVLLKIKEIANSKTELQRNNKDLQELNFNLQVRNDYLEHQKAAIQELQLKLRRTYTDEASLTIMDLTHKLSDYRMSQLRAKRQSGLLKEKEQYYLRVNNAHTENIKDLENEMANWQSKYNEREQFWRKRLAQQVKLMQDIQKQVSASRQEQRNAETFFREEKKQQAEIQNKYDSLPQEKQRKLNSLLPRRDSTNDNAVFELKAKIQELHQQLMEKEKENYQLKASFKELVPEAKLTDFAGQMGASTTNFLMQTQLTTSQLKNNARRFINNQKDQEQYYKQEAMKVNQAAQQSIDTLQRIIDDKNEQIRRKQHTIESLRKEFLKVKDQDTHQIQLLHQELRELRTKAQVGSVNELMNRPTGKNFYGGAKTEEVAEIRALLAKKEEDYKLLLDKYDRLFISKDKKSQEQSVVNHRIVERKLQQLQTQREIEKKRAFENEQRLTLKIKNLEKLSKEKDMKLSKLQKTLIDLKNLAVNEATHVDSQEMEIQLKEAIADISKGKTANDSKMEITMQKSLQAVQQLTKQNRQYQKEVKRLKEDKFAKTTFKK